MQVFKFLLPLIFLAFACEKDNTTKIRYNAVYKIDTVAVYSSALEKDKEKSSEQFISVLYNDLYGSSISPNLMNQLSVLNSAIGDKKLSIDLVVRNVMNDSSIKLPDNDEMRKDIPAFVRQTYLRFYERYPSAAEQKFLVSLIESDININPEMVYNAFVTSNEYLFY